MSYDSWKLGGDYRRDQIIVECEECGTLASVTSETEYGAATWTPEECPICGHPYGENTRELGADEPDPDRAYDLMREEQR